MRAQAMEKVLRKIVDELDEVGTESVIILNLKVKAKIILDREDDRAASVIREMINS